MKDAVLYLEDGTTFHGRSLLTHGETMGEVVFNTALTGYQEILTDPSYAGQIVLMTYPLIGNYGVNDVDIESNGVHVKGFIAKEFCRTHSNFRATNNLIDYLHENNIIALEGIDTRALTRHLRLSGAMKGIISTEDTSSTTLHSKIEQLPSMEGADWVKEVTTDKKYVWKAEGKKKFKIAVIDCGIKFNILRILASLGCECHVFPASTSAEELFAIEPDGLFVSNGPGDPAAVTYVIDTLKEVLSSGKKLPIFGICLGNQLLGLALGGKTYKLKFGHHGGNHPVKDFESDIIGITSQNHGFCLDMKTLPQDDVHVIHQNLNDQTVEGIQHQSYPLFSIQYHPEAAPGPNDAKYLFNKFIDMMEHSHAKA